MLSVLIKVVEEQSLTVDEAFVCLCLVQNERISAVEFFISHKFSVFPDLREMEVKVKRKDLGDFIEFGRYTAFLCVLYELIVMSLVGNLIYMIYGGSFLLFKFLFFVLLKLKIHL